MRTNPAFHSASPYRLSQSNTNRVNTEIEINSYLSNQGYSVNRFVHNLYHAIFSIQGSDGTFIGNCFAISQDLLLTCHHCLEGRNEIKGNFGMGKLIFDGSKYEFDFAILWVKGGQFKPVVLDMDIDIGDSVQLYHKFEGQSLKMYVKTFGYQSITSSGGGSYAMRGNFVSSQTNPGESGAPRMSLRNSYVHAMHQGNSEGLTMNALYGILEFAKTNGDRNADYILSNIQVAHLDTRIMNQSPLIIKSDDVEEEKKP
ncbi:trypsin-like peptidase domain-containing protein [Candidatus Protochlamydia sp. R18]|uniref:trypsin-like peptidase domain-containing protein n=1 Tax=Candidatus Protochlamydia sp. R18 TaxID=1353977 RepID=UPI0005A741C1|nr:trypsin-like peptidase domain-containing protein [Candidatus Protochlamydia sp. R18]